MNTSPKTRELLNILDTIETAYNPSSPRYQFTHVFYNIVETPVERPYDFPIDLWTKYFLPGTPLQPVILNRQQIEERKRIQEDLLIKLADSRSGILKKLEGLKFKRELVKNKLQSTVGKFRMKVRRFVSCIEEGGMNVQTEIVEREKYGVKERKEEVLRQLGKMKERLEQLKRQVEEGVQVYERGFHTLK